MKPKELKALSQPDMENKLSELKKELMKFNTQIATGTFPKNPTKVRQLKKTIARIYTLKNARNQKTKGGEKKL